MPALAVAAVTIGVQVPSHPLAASTPGADEESIVTPPWSEVVPGGDCQCADGAEFSFFVREADPAKVLLFFEGGGACWDATTCAFTDGVPYDWNLGPDEDPALQSGIFDLDHPENPFADHTMVYVPYCTGDVHIGNATQEYTPDLTVQHKGFVNGQAALLHLVATYGDADDVVVAGASAGSIATPLYGGLVADALPDARVTVFGDGSGGYPDIPGINALIGNAWGTMNAVPGWPENADATVENWSIPGLWVRAGRHAPDVTMARFDYAFDETQVFFAGLAGIDAAGLVDFMDDNEATIEAAGVEQHSYTAPGSEHTLVQRDEFYTMEVEGVRLVDWVTALVAGDDVDDVHCTECEAP